MIYRLTVLGFDSGLNELLGGRYYDFRTKKYHNYIKTKNDSLCSKYIRLAPGLRGVTIIEPIVIHYKFYCKDKRRDRLNVASAFEKSFADSLQTCGVIRNDGWNDILNVTYDFEIDKNNPRVEIEIEEVDERTKVKMYFE